jgi:hypothetical protein
METDIITSIVASTIERAAILVIMYVETFNSDVIFLSARYNVIDLTLTDKYPLRIHT